MPKWKLYLKISINFIIFILFLVFILLFLPKLIRFFFPIIIGWIVSMIANPLVKVLEKKFNIVRKFSSALLIIFTIVGVFGGLYAIMAIIIKELIELSNDIPRITEMISTSIVEVQENLQSISQILPEFLKADVPSIDLTKVVQTITDSLTAYMTIDNASSFARNIADVVFYFIISVLFAFFFTADREQIVEKIKAICPQSVMEYVSYIINGFKLAVGGYIKAQLKLMIIMLIILFIGLEVLRVDYSFLLALGIAILDVLPFFGTGAVLWPWAIADFLLGNYFRGVGIIIIYVLCQVIKQVLQPKMVGDSIGMSPLSTLIFMFVGFKMFGVIGLIIGIPVGMILINLYRIGLFERVLRGLKIIVSDINNFRKF